jgi:type II secretion system protein J
MNRISDCENRIEQRKINPQLKGFTLLEVLIAIAIMAGIVTVIYSTFFTAGNNVQQAEEIRDTTDLVRTLVSKLSNDIANAYVNTGMNAPNAQLTIFLGKKVQPPAGTQKSRFDELYLTTLTNWRRPGSKETDLWEVGYYFKEKLDGPGRIMMRREKRELNKDVPVLEGGVEYELTDRVESLQLRYKSGTTWLDEWNISTTLPKVVEITLLLDDGSVYVTEVQVLNATGA